MSDDERPQVIQVKNVSKFKNFNSNLSQSAFNLSRTQRCTQQCTGLLSRNKSIISKSKKETSEDLAKYIIDLEKDENLVPQKNKSNKNEIKHFCSNCQAPLDIFSHPESHSQKCNIDSSTLPECTLKDACSARNTDHYKSNGHQWLAELRKGKFSNNPHYSHQLDQNENKKRYNEIDNTCYNTIESYVLNSNLERTTEILSDENKTSNNNIPKENIDCHKPHIENTLLNENSKEAPQAYSLKKTSRGSTVIILDEDSSTNSSKTLFNIPKKSETPKKPLPKESINRKNDFRDNDLQNQIVSNQSENSNDSDNNGYQNEIQSLNEEEVDVPQASSINKTNRTSSKISSRVSTTSSKTLPNFPKFSEKLQKKNLEDLNRENDLNVVLNPTSNQNKNSTSSNDETEYEIKSLSSNKRINKLSHYKKYNKKPSIYSKRSQSSSPNPGNQNLEIDQIVNDFASTQSIEYQPQNQTPSRVASTKSNCLSNQDEADIENDYFKKIIIDCKSNDCQACINININRNREMEKEIELFANLTKSGWENVSLECTAKDKGFQSILLEICKCKFILNFIIILQSKPAPIKWNFKISQLNNTESDKNLFDCALKESEQIKINEVKTTKQLEAACKNNKNQAFTEKLLKRKLLSKLNSSQSDDNNYHPSQSLLANLKQNEELIEESSSNHSKETKTKSNNNKNPSLMILDSESFSTIDADIDTNISKNKCLNSKNGSSFKLRQKENSKLNVKTKYYGIEKKRLKYIKKLNSSLKIKLASEWIENANCMIKDFSFDAFKHKTAKAFFLTHYNIKILDDLNIRAFKKIIYCSEFTADLLCSQYHVPKNNVMALSLGKSYDIFDKKVTIVDSNFCRGSVMFLVESKNENSYLYTGPSQLNFMMEMNPEFWNIKENFDLYLDTRHYDNRNMVKDVSQVIDMIKKQVKKETLIVINILPLCGISLWSTLADCLKCKVWAFKFYRSSLKDETLLSKLTPNSSLAQLHIISELKTSINILNEYLNKLKTFSSLLILEIENPKYELITLNSRIRLLKLPYTEHSNYEDIQRFYKYLGPENCYSLAYNDKIPN